MGLADRYYLERYQTQLISHRLKINDLARVDSPGRMKQ
jgi:hypothetical protein